MKKYASRILVVLILCAALCAALLTLGAANPAAGPIYTVDEPYIYPELDWSELDTLDKKIAACHVDVDLMESMTTPALLETVLTYPLLANVFAFNTPEGGFASVSRYFEGLELLAAREDAEKCLLDFAQDPERVARICEYESLRIYFIYAIAWYLDMDPEPLNSIMQPAAATQPAAAASAGKAIYTPNGSFVLADYGLTLCGQRNLLDQITRA